MSSVATNSTVYQAKMEAFRRDCASKIQRLPPYQSGKLSLKKKLSTEDAKCQEVMAKHVSATVDVLFSNTKGLPYTEIFCEGQKGFKSALNIALREILKINGASKAKKRHAGYQKKLRKVGALVRRYLAEWNTHVKQEVEDKKKKQVYENKEIMEEACVCHPFFQSIQESILLPYFRSEQGACLNLSSLKEKIKEKRRDVLSNRAKDIINCIGRLTELTVSSPYYRGIYREIDILRRSILETDREGQDGIKTLINDVESLVERFTKRDEHLLILSGVIENISIYSDFKGRFFEAEKKVNDIFQFWNDYTDVEGTIITYLHPQGNVSSGLHVEVFIDDLD